MKLVFSQRERRNTCEIFIFYLIFTSYQLRGTTSPKRKKKLEEAVSFYLIWRSLIFQHFNQFRCQRHQRPLFTLPTLFTFSYFRPICVHADEGNAEKRADKVQWYTTAFDCQLALIKFTFMGFVFFALSFFYSAMRVRFFCTRQ